jgi:hypothetical protein
VNVSTVKRSPHATDRRVGNHARMRRKMQGMTQQKLGDALGVTFQQVQKYESDIPGAPAIRPWARFPASHGSIVASRRDPDGWCVSPQGYID